MEKSDEREYHMWKRLRTEAEKGDAFSFDIQRQEESNWCWAAVSATVLSYYDNDTDWTQCDIATAVLKVDACTGDRSAPHINKQTELDKALRVVGCLKRMTDKKVPEKVVFQEIAQRRPVCVRIGWTGEGGHFVVIRGWFIGMEGAVWYIVEDPIKIGGGTRMMTAAKFENAYGNLGRSEWTHSYFVGSPTSGAKHSDAGYP
jgi:hypothetical protein